MKFSHSTPLMNRRFQRKRLFGAKPLSALRVAALPACALPLVARVSSAALLPAAAHAVYFLPLAHVVFSSLPGSALPNTPDRALLGKKSKIDPRQLRLR